MKKSEKSIVKINDSMGKTLDLLSIPLSLIPTVGSLLSSVLSGVSTDLKFKRVQELLKGFSKDFNELKSKVSTRYMQTEEFEDLFEKTLTKTANEQNKEKRKLFRKFLKNSIKNPTVKHDEQIRFLNVLEELQIDELRVIKSIQKKPQKGTNGLQFPSLHSILKDLERDELRDLIMHLDNMCVTEIVDNGGMHVLTPFGKRFIKYIMET
jgi:hypothetical protein